MAFLFIFNLAQFILIEAKPNATAIFSPQVKKFLCFDPSTGKVVPKVGMANYAMMYDGNLAIKGLSLFTVSPISFELYH